MYSVASAHPTIVYVTPQRSLCSRITAFLLMLVCCYILVSSVVSVAVFATASDESLKNFVSTVEKATEDLVNGVVAVEAVTETPVVVPVSVAISPVEVVAKQTAEQTTESLMGSFEMVPPMPTSIFASIPRAAVIVFAVVSAVAVVAASLYAAYVSSEDVQLFVSNAVVTVQATFEQLVAEVTAAAQSLYQQVAAFDFQGMLNDFVAFWQSVFAEIQSYFETAKAYFMSTTTAAAKDLEDLSVPVLDIANLPEIEHGLGENLA